MRTLLPRRKAHRTHLKRQSVLRQLRQFLGESLEPRYLLASDLDAPSSSVPVNPLAWVANPSQQGGQGVSFALSEQAAEGENGTPSFGSGLLVALSEIQRVLTAVGQGDDLQASLPFLGRLSAQTPGGLSSIDTVSLHSLFRLAERFEQQVIVPLVDYLDQFPQATPEQLIQHFSFLTPVAPASSDARGIQISFDFSDIVSSPLDSLLQALQADQVFQTDLGASLAAELQFEYSTSSLQFGVVQDLGSTADSGAAFSVGLPNLTLNLKSLPQLPTTPASFLSTHVGFLFGQLNLANIELDARWQIDLATVADGLRSQYPDSELVRFNGLRLDRLQALSSGEIVEIASPRISGNGLNIDLPFSTSIPGWNWQDILPRFQLTDPQPFNSIAANWETIIPSDAPYAAAAFQALASLSASEVLGLLSQIGQVIGSWQQGSLLNTPLPLANGLTVGDAMGLVESYDTRILAFLQDPATNMPRFRSLQEFMDLMMTTASSVYGPLPQIVRYDSDLQQLFISLDFFRQPDPIIVQANLNAFAGNPTAPFASLQMTPGTAGIDNRLVLSRSASLGLELALDLAPRTQEAPSPYQDLAIHSGLQVARWTPLQQIYARHGRDDLFNVGNTATLQLQDGSTATMSLGGFRQSDAIADVLRRSAVVRNNVLIADLTLESGHLVINDYTVGTNEFRLTNRSGLFQAFFETNGVASVASGAQILSLPMHATLVDYHGMDTQLAALLGPLAGPLSEQEGASLEVGLQDGTTTTLHFINLQDYTLGSLLDALTVVRNGETILSASFNGSRITLHDHTARWGGHRLSVAWANATSGTTWIEHFIEIGPDIDRDGQLAGPSLFPTLSNEHRPPLDSAMRLGPILKQDLVLAEILGTTSAATMQLADGSTVEIHSGLITEELTVGELLERLRVQRDGVEIVTPFISGDRIALVDRTIGNQLTEMYAIGGIGFFSYLYSDASPYIAAKPRIFTSKSFLPAAVNSSDSITYFVDESQSSSSDPGATFHLRDGSSVSLSLGSFNIQTTLTDIAAALTTVRNGKTVLFAVPGSRGLLIYDLTIPQHAEAVSSFRSLGPGATQTILGGSGWATAIHPGRMEVELLRLPAHDPTHYRIVEDNIPAAPAWMPVATLMRRLALAPAEMANEVISLRLRDGTTTQLFLPQDAYDRSLVDLARDTRVMRNGQVLVQLRYRAGKFEILDLSPANGVHHTTIESLEGPLVQALFDPLSLSDSNGISSIPLNQTVFHSQGAAVPLESLVSNSIDIDAEATPLRITTRSGEQFVARLGSLRENTLHSLLSKLTIAREGNVVLYPSVENGRIDIISREGRGDDWVSFEWAEPTSIDSPNGSAWPKLFLPLGSESPDQGALFGAPFLPPVPTLASVAGSTRVADLLTRWNVPLPTNNSSAVLRLRDGTQLTANLAPPSSATTVSDLLSQLRLQRNGQLVVSARLVDDTIELTDHTGGSGTFVVTPSSAQPGDGQFFALLGFSLADPEGSSGSSARVRGRTLSSVASQLQTTLGELPQLSSADFNGTLQQIDLRLANGATQTIDLGSLSATTTIDDLLTSVNSQLGSIPQVRVGYGENQLWFTDLTVPANNSAITEVIASRGTIAQALFSLGGDYDRDGRLGGKALLRPLGATAIAHHTTVESYLISRDLTQLATPDTATLTIELRDGTSEQRTLVYRPGMSLMEYASQLRIERGNQTLLQVHLRPTRSSDGSTTYRFIVEDLSIPSYSQNSLRVRHSVDNVVGTSSQLPLFIGLLGQSEPGVSVINGVPLEIPVPEDRMRLLLTEPPVLYAEVNALAENVQASARLGELLGVSIENGSGQAAASVRLEVIPPVDRDYWTLTELLDALVQPADVVRVTAESSLQFVADLNADLGGLNVAVDDPALQPRIRFDWPQVFSTDPRLQLDFTSLQPPQIENYSELVRLKDLTVADITEFTRRLVDLVERMTGEDLLGRRLPLINTSLAEVLDSVDAVSQLVDAIVHDPNATLKDLEHDLEESLGLSDEQLTLSYDSSLHALRMDVDLEYVPLQSLHQLDLDIAQSNIPGLDSFVDFRAEGQLELTAGVDFQLHVGLDLDDLRTGSIDNAVIVYDTTSAVASARVDAQGLQFTTAVGPLGVSVGPGSVALDRDGLPFGSSGNTTQPATLGITLPSSSNGHRRLSQLTANTFVAQFQGVAGLDLPLALTVGNTNTQPFQIHWPDLNSVQFSNVASINASGGNQIVVPNFNELIDDFSLLDGVHALAVGLEGLFDWLQQYLGDEILGLPVPLIGEGLADAVDFLDRLRDALSDPLDVPGLPAAAARQVIFDVLGPSGSLAGGQGILADRNGDGAITVDDVGLESGDGELVYRLKIGQSSVPAVANIGLDVGVPALGLEVQGEAAIQFGYGFEIGFGIHESNGVFLELIDGEELDLSFTASVASIAAEGRLGPLFIAATTIPAANLSDEQRRASRLDADDPTSEAINAITGQYHVDLGQGRIYLTQPASYSLLQIETSAALAGSLHLEIVTSISGNEQLPSIGTNLHLTWASTSGSIDEVVTSLVRPTIEFTDLSLDLGSFVSNVLAPVLTPVNDLLDPFRPVLSAITTPIPILSDLAGQAITMTDLMALTGSGGRTVGEFIDAISLIVQLIDIPVIDGRVKLPLGNFIAAYNGDQLEATPSGTAFGGTGGFGQFLNTLQDASLREYLQNLPAADAEDEGDAPLFQVPLLTNPATAIGILLGQDVPLLTFDMPRLEAEFRYSQYIPIWPIFGVRFGGSVGVAADFAFGYDTKGIRDFAASRRASDLLNGFYISDTENPDGSGEDVAEVVFTGQLTAAGELNLLAAQAGVEGGLRAVIELNLNDPDADGKVRGQELIDNMSLGRHPLLGPLWIFDASGKLSVAFRAYVNTPVWDGELELGEIVIVDFEIPRPDPFAGNPTLAHVDANGTLIVHIGPNAHLREEGDLSDGDDSVTVSLSPDQTQWVVSAFGIEQPFSNVQSIFIDGGNGNDRIEIAPSVITPVTLKGGRGNDWIKAGGGTAMIEGGDGDDEIFGSSVDDVIYAGAGNDRVYAGAGNDTIYLGTGDDTASGEAGDDTLHGEDGEDVLQGGLGNDLIIGGLGHDTIRGGAGDDALWGDLQNGLGVGNDHLDGGNGNDILYGGQGSDYLLGGLGSDQLFGGAGDDTLIAGQGNEPGSRLTPAEYSATHYLDGGVGNDLIYGDFGDDVVIDLAGNNQIWTFAGNDTITTGSGNDRIDSGNGDDVIDAGEGNNSIFADAGFDIVRAGYGNDFVDLRPGAGRGTAGGRFGSQVTLLGGDNVVHGDLGDDIIITGAGNDWISVGDGNNQIISGLGNDVIRSGTGDDWISSVGGDNDISSGAGNDHIVTGSGRDIIDVGPGDDDIQSGGGDDFIRGGDGNDRIHAGSGNDSILGGNGDDVLIGGTGNDRIEGGAGQDVIWGGNEHFTRVELLGSEGQGLQLPDGYSIELAYPGFDPPRIRPTILQNQSLAATIGDGDDMLLGQEGTDWIFGDQGNDTIEGGQGADYLDGGAQRDQLSGGAESDILLGGTGDDILRGGAGIDFLYGGADHDQLFGDQGVTIQGEHHLFGQLLRGDDGNDQLFAFAPTGNTVLEAPLWGDRLEGGNGNDRLMGNLRREVLLGGLGDDTLEGDGLSGPFYAANNLAATTGGADVLYGEGGDDRLLGGGGDDVMWGGRGSDYLEGQAGFDSLYGGSDIDFIQLDVDPAYRVWGDRIDGHFGNQTPGDSDDQGATDILLINGTSGNDTILLSEDSLGRLSIAYNTRSIVLPWRDAANRPTIEQFQINGLAGDDILGFNPEQDSSWITTSLSSVSDWTSVIQGGSGNDQLYGSPGRDRISGGRGSDTIYGFAGDDRLYGDEGDGTSNDIDTLYAGAGNDDLLGGTGRNVLYAWSRNPHLGTAFGIYRDSATGQLFDSPGLNSQGIPLVLEDTGLNRMLGREGDDRLYAGTGLDFLYGGGGSNTLHTTSGSEFTSSLGVPEDERWLEYARATDKVWYYSGTGANDRISIDYVTEPGLLGDHHLITRQTENQGFVTFDAQIRLDFEATDADGQRIWDPADIVYTLEEITAIEDPKARRLASAQTDFEQRLLPPEGDFMAIIVDALAGDDHVSIGPTVQRSVWVAAGSGNDQVVNGIGTPLLADLADGRNRNEVLGSPMDPRRAAVLSSDWTGDSDTSIPSVERSTQWRDLTLDGPRDVDWYQFSIAATPHQAASLVVDSLAVGDELQVQLFGRDETGDLQLLAEATPSSATGSIPQQTGRGSRLALPLSSGLLQPDTVYWLRVLSESGIPTQYDLALDLVHVLPGGLAVVPSGASVNAVRRDVLMGGPGHDVLQGGAGEDWIIGGDGNDVLSGGWDRGASDILLGEAGDDLFQVLPDQLSVAADGAALNVTFADEFDGGSGYNRVLYVGGDLDTLNRPIPDHVTVEYNRMLGSYRMTQLVWDSANQEFMRDGDAYQIWSAQYHTRNIAGTLFQLGAGDDELHLESDYFLPRPDGTTDDRGPYGVSGGDRQAGAASFVFEVQAGSGNDRIYGSPYADVIYGGEGIDFISGEGDDDQVFAGPSDDMVVGDEATATSITPFDRYEVYSSPNTSRRNDAPSFATWLDLSQQTQAGLSLHNGDRGDWYLLPVPAQGGILRDTDFDIDFTWPESQSVFNDPRWQTKSLQVIPARLDSTNGTGYIPSNGPIDAYWLHVRNPLAAGLTADNALAIGQLASPVNVTLRVAVNGGLPRSIGPVSVDASFTSQQLVAAIDGAIQAAGLSSSLFAHYDTRHERLSLLPRQDVGLQITGDLSSGIQWLGFTSGQTNAQGGLPLGPYSLSTARILNASPAIAPQTPQPMRSPLARPDIVSVAPLPLIDISDSTVSLAAAQRVEGSNAFEQFSQAASVGDINGDGVEDTIAWGNTEAIILLGSHTFARDSLLASDIADYRVTLRDGWQPISGGADLDEDGRAEIAFWRIAETNRIEVGILPGHSWREHMFGLLPTLRYVAVLPFDQPVEDADFAWAHFDADNKADLLVFARKPVLTRGVGRGYGGIVNGTWLLGAMTNQFPAASAQQLDLWLTDTSQSHTAVLSSITAPGDWQRAANANELGFDLQAHAVTGDFDGDGMEEIAVTKPQGWAFTDQRSGASISVSRTYLVDTNGVVNSNISLGNTFARGRIQTVASFEETPHAASRLAALSQDQPMLAGDLDADGRSDLILARDFVPKTGTPINLLAYTGQQLSDSKPLTEADAYASFSGLFVGPTETMQGLSMGYGDVDGDRTVDIVIGAAWNLDGRGSSQVIFNPSEAVGAIDVRTDSYGDSRRDWLEITGNQIGDFTGRIAPRLHDLNLDGRADLLIGAAGLDSATSGQNAGGIYFVPGMARRVAMPAANQFTVLANESIRGIGDVLIDRGNSVTFSAGPEFVIDRQAERWFEFTTLGDGDAGNLIRLSPSADLSPTTLLDGVSGDVPRSPTEAVRSAVATMEIGGADERRGVIEVDLSSLFDVIENPSSLSGASLKLQASIAAEALQVPYFVDYLTPTVAGGGFPERVFFTGYTSGSEQELWVTDGTSGGTRIIRGGYSQPLAVLGHRVLVTTFVCTRLCEPGSEEGIEGYEQIWLHDGEQATYVADSESRLFGNVFQVDERILMTHASEDGSIQLFELTLNASGNPQLSLVAKMRDAEGDLQKVMQLHAIDGGMILVRQTSTGYQMWRVETNNVEPTLLGTFDTGDFTDVPGQYAIEFNGGLLFTATAAGQHEQLWFSDGTAAGTRLLKVVNPNGDSLIHAMEELEGRVFFIANGHELWVTDGTTAGTAKLRDLFADQRPTWRLSHATVADKHYVVAISSNGVSFPEDNVTLFSIDAAGDLTRTTVFSGRSGGFVTSLTTVDDHALIGYRLTPVGGGFATRGAYLAMVQPSTGNVIQLGSVTGTSDSFEQPIALSGDRLVMVGPRFGDVSHERIWTSDLSAAGTVPLEIASGGQGSGQAATLVVEIAPALGDQEITRDDIVGRAIFRKVVTVNTATSGIIEIDLAQSAKELADLRRLFELGYRSVAIRLSVEGALVTAQAPAIAEGTGLYLNRSAGVVGALFDAQGRQLSADWTVADLRNLTAGSYRLRVTAADPSQITAIPFSIHVEPPALGHSHITTNNDWLDGGDGDDLLIGGPGIDRVYGRSGRDRFQAELFEISDRDSNETRLDIISDDSTTLQIDTRLLLDPVAVIQPLDGPQRTLAADEFAIVDEQLAQAIAAALGTTVRLVGDRLEFAREVRASELATITQLDLSGLGLTSLAGLEYLTGLVTLDLSHNSLNAAALQPLVPAVNGRKGTAQLRHLNLDGMRVNNLSRLASLTQLRVLSLANQTVNLSNVNPLSSLTHLVYLNLTGNVVSNVANLSPLRNLRVLELADNDLTSLSHIAGMFIVDDSDPATVTSPLLRTSTFSTEGAYGDSFRFFAATGVGSSTLATYKFGKLPENEYELYASWIGNDFNNPAAQWQVGSARFFANEQSEPGDLRLDDTRFARLGTFTYQAGAADLEVALRTGAASGVILADAVFLQSRLRPMPNLLRLDVRQNALDDDQYLAILPALENSGTEVERDLFKPPYWDGLPAVQVAPGGTTIVIEDLYEYAFAAEGLLVFSATADDPNVSLVLDDSKLVISSNGLSQRPIKIELVAVDENGREGKTWFYAAFGLSLIAGQINVDQDRDGFVGEADQPLSGHVVYLDVDHNGLSTDDPQAVTDPSGRYVIWADKEGTFSLRAVVPAFIDSLNPNAHLLTLNQGGSAHNSIDSLALPAIIIEGTRWTAEGSLLTITADTVGDIAGSWVISGGPIADRNDSVANAITFRPLQSGLYEARFSYTDQSRTLTRSHWISVYDIAPTLDVGADLTAANGIPQGHFELTRSMIVDPGSDTWTVTIDYGDGSDPVELRPQSQREISLEHLYQVPGIYEIGIRVSNQEGWAFETLLVEVLPTPVEISLAVVSSQGGNSTVFEGQEALFDITVHDPTFTANVGDWSYSVDWGDGTTESFASSIVFTDQMARMGQSRLAHTYALQGEYSVFVRVVDSLGTVSERILNVDVANAAPQIQSFNLPNMIEQGQSVLWSVAVFDLDATKTHWTMLPGAEPITGSELVWAYGQPGTYQIEIMAIDNEGAITRLIHEIEVNSVNAIPRLNPVLPQTLYVGENWSYSLQASDNDADAVLRFDVVSGPAGLVVDGQSGEMSWNPPLSVAGTEEVAWVSVSDQFGDMTLQSITLNVYATSTIVGIVFHDLNRNGHQDIDEPGLSGIEVRMDQGRDGSVDVVALTDSQGVYSFEQLPLASYGLTVVLPAFWEGTTPFVQTLDIAVPGVARAIASGMTGDSDGDGRSNRDELELRGGDANQDGILDSRQSHVAGITSANGSTVLLVGPVGTTIDRLRISSLPRTAPTTIHQDYGLIEFELTGLPAGGQATVEVRWLDGPVVNAIYKYVPREPQGESQWGQLEETSAIRQASVEFMADRALLHLYDGAWGDADWQVNGRIADPLALGFVDADNHNPGWTNPDNALDVNGDGLVTPLDALIVINHLARIRQGVDQWERPRQPGEGYVDVNGDSRLTPIDALIVINRLSRR